MNASDYKKKLHTIQTRGITKQVTYHNYLRGGFSYHLQFHTILQMVSDKCPYGLLKYWERMGYIIPRVIVKKINGVQIKLYRLSDINAVADAILARDYRAVRNYWMTTYIEGLPTNER